MRCEPMLRWSLVSAILALGITACHTPPPASPPKSEAPPEGPVTLSNFRFMQPERYFLVFKPEKNYDQGIELEYLLLDGSGQTLKMQRTGVGPIFSEGKPLSADKEQRVKLENIVDQELVIRGARAYASQLRSPTVDLRSVQTLKLVQIFPCQQMEDEWEPGMPLPPGIEEVPHQPTVFVRQECDHTHQLPDKKIAATLRLAREKVPDRGSLDISATFHQEFPRGSFFTFSFFDEKERLIPMDCQLQVRQPPVSEQTVVEYHFELSGQKTLARFRQVRRVEISKFFPHSGGVSEMQSVMVCP